MSIASRQVTKEVNRIIGDSVKDGYFPNIEYILSELSNFYKRVTIGFPSFQLRKQLYRKVWDVDKYNINLSEIYDDLNNLYEEIVSQFTIVLRDFDYYDTERRKLMHEVREWNSELSSLLLIAEDTDGYLYSVHDYFIDRAKIDLEYSTCEINTDAGIVTLRESRQGIKKVNMSHYFDVVNYPILAEERFADSLVSNKLLAGSKFGYAFSDIYTSWAQNITSRSNGELQVSFIINLDPNLEEGIYVSRIEMLGQSITPMHVEPLWSLDNINFRALPMGSGLRSKIVSDDKKTIWNFSETKAKYLKFLITKYQEDETVGISTEPLYRYIIGFKNIEIFKMAYDRTSTLYSTAFSVTDSTNESLTIDKASIIVDEDIQSGTDIEYYLSLGSDDTDDPTEYSWVQVGPLNRSNPEEPRVADFRHAVLFAGVPDIQWSSSSYGTALETYNNISFYKVYQFPYEPVRDSVTLYRGKDNWQVKPAYDISRTAVYDEENTFGSGNTVTLTYPDFTPVEGNGLIRGSIRVKSDPGENPDYVYIPTTDYIIDYVNNTITRTTASAIESNVDAATNTVYVDYQYDKEVSELTEYVTYIYVLNRVGIDINIAPFTSAEKDAGQFLYIDTEDGTIDLSSETFIHITQGWHKITTTAEPRSSSDRFYSVNDNKYLYQKVYKMYAYGEKLQEVSWFELRHNVRKLDHSKYCIIDYDGDGNKEIVVNYSPQTAKWAMSYDDLLCSDGTAETYVISYRYISELTDTIYFKVLLSREKDTSHLVTPTLRGYTIKLGY